MNSHELQADYHPLGMLQVELLVLQVEADTMRVVKRNILVRRMHHTMKIIRVYHSTPKNILGEVIIQTYLFQQSYHLRFSSSSLSISLNSSILLGSILLSILLSIIFGVITYAAEGRMKLVQSRRSLHALSPCSEEWNHS